MRRIVPNQRLWTTPCSLCAVASALKAFPENTDAYLESLRDDGYASLSVANKFIRSNLPVAKRTDFKRGERPKLCDLHLDGKAIVCVREHYVYVDHEDYWSFFDNDNDEVVTVWRLK